MENIDNNLWLDLETTSLDLWKVRIIQMALIYKGQSKCFLINPTIPIDPKASFINHIYDKDVENLPTFSKYAPTIFNLLSECDYICGYNIKKFDLPILQSELLRCGYELPYKPIIDVFDYVNLLEPDKKLTSVYLRYFNKNLKDAHNAQSDINASKEVYEFIKNKLKE